MTDTAKINVEVMQDFSEIVHYDHPGIPLYIRMSKLSHYPNKQALCHWHEDIELIRIYRGQMNYYINGKCILLNENDCIMIFSRQMHYGYSEQQQECDFGCILFHPSLFTNNKLLTQDYVISSLEQSNLEYLHFDSSTPYGQEMMKILDKMIELKKDSQYAYEMDAIGLMHIFWGHLLRHIGTLPQNRSDPPHVDLTSQKDMVSYIFQHYGEKILLEDIAAAGHVCRSKCCNIFKQYLQQSPIDFLNSYRLKVSCNLLTNTDFAITYVALSCGFNHLSYFSKMFFNTYGCTPSEYRKKIVDRTY